MRAHSKMSQVCFEVVIPHSDIIYEVMPDGGLLLKIPVLHNGDIKHDLSFIGELSRILLLRAIAHRGR